MSPIPTNEKQGTDCWGEGEEEDGEPEGCHWEQRGGNTRILKARQQEVQRGQKKRLSIVGKTVSDMVDFRSQP